MKFTSPFVIAALLGASSVDAINMNSMTMKLAKEEPAAETPAANATADANATASANSTESTEAAGTKKLTKAEIEAKVEAAAEAAWVK